MDGNFLHLATALDPQWKDLKKSSREGCLRKMRAALDLLKREEDVARDKVDAPKPKRKLLDINESDSNRKSKMDELTKYLQMNFLVAATRTEPLGADKNSLDWWKAKKEEYPTLAKLARKYLCVS